MPPMRSLIVSSMPLGETILRLLARMLTTLSRDIGGDAGDAAAIAAVDALAVGAVAACVAVTGAVSASMTARKLRRVIKEVLLQGRRVGRVPREPARRAIAAAATAVPLQVSVASHVPAADTPPKPRRHAIAVGGAGQARRPRTAARTSGHRAGASLAFTVALRSCLPQPTDGPRMAVHTERTTT